MARWKARVEFLLSVIELLFLSLTLSCYKAKRVKTRCYQEGVGHLEPRFQGEGVVPRGYFFSQTRHILLSKYANCIVLRAVVLTQYRRVADGQTDGIAIASTALAMRALRRAVKTVRPMLSDRCLSVLSVTLLYCSQTVGRIKTKLGIHVPGHIVLDEDQAPPPPKGNSPPNFRPISVAAKWLHGSRRHLVWR